MVNTTNTSNQTNILAAIVFTDVKDSTRLMTVNRDRTLQAIVRDRQILESICSKHGGKVVKSLGDGLLMYFTSAENSVTSAIVMQKTLAELALNLPPEDVLEHRIGIHLSDVVFINGDIMGDGVNIASRIQSCAKPWGICISRVIFDSISAVVKVPIDDGGLRELKGIPYWVRVYHLIPVEPKIATREDDGLILEEPLGQVPPHSPFYIDRPPIERDCFEAIEKTGALIRIKAPRQMGKSSLLGKILHHASQHGCQIISLNFQSADSSVFADLDKFLRWFCAIVGRQLKLKSKISDFWDEIYGSKDNCTAYFEDYILPNIAGALVISLDEVDLLFRYRAIAEDFFGLLRAWHEAAKNHDLWKRLRLIVVHSQEVYIPLNINQSPFNVGLPIELREFTREQVTDLVDRHELRWTDVEIDRLMAMVGGHPYLVRVALYYIARNNTNLDEVLRNAPTEAGIYSDHLRRHLWNLEQNPKLAEAMKKLVSSKEAVRLPSEETFKLDCMGLSLLQGNDAIPRCNLYQLYFSDRLGIR